MVHRLYHTHLVIPGQRFDSFLSEVVAFLKAHPTEVVTIRTCADGIKKCDIPSASVITSFAQNALSGSGIQLGDSSCFQKSISSLRSTNTRLILVQNNAKYDSYSDGAYATLNPSTIINNFNNMKTSGQAGNDFTVLQCQVRSNIMHVGHHWLLIWYPSGNCDRYHRCSRLCRHRCQLVDLSPNVDKIQLR